LALVRAVLAAGGPAMLFQPVVDLQAGRPVGVEALARFTSDAFLGTEAWFAAADRVSMGVELELAAIRSSTAQLGALPDGVFLSVNASVRTACSIDLDAHLRSLPRDRVVLELTEHAQITDFTEVNGCLAPHRAAGLRLAIDDTGAGYASFHHLLQLQPDIIKLDIELTRDIDSDPARRSLAVALTAFAAEVGAEVIAEGIETEAELQVLRDLHVPWGQGYHLGRPGPLPLVA
jgi:EAL domain-containing protein (putative c-di-GMP-specific phosphodiesterase class I)